MAPICSNNTTTAACLASHRLSAAYSKTIMAGGSGEFAINCRATAPWSLNKAKKLANNLKPGVTLGYIPLAKCGHIKWDEGRRSLIVPGLGSLLCVSHPDSKPSNPANIGCSKYYHCHSCTCLTVHDVVTKSKNTWNRDTGHKWEGNKWFKHKTDPQLALANGGHIDSNSIWWSNCSYNLTSGWPTPQEVKPQPSPKDNMEEEVKEEVVELPAPPPCTPEVVKCTKCKWNAAWDKAREKIEALIANAGQAIANLEPHPPTGCMPCNANVLKAYCLVQCRSWIVEQLNKWLDHCQEQWALWEQQELERLQQRHQEELDKLDQDKWD